MTLYFFKVTLALAVPLVGGKQSQMVSTLKAYEIKFQHLHPLTSSAKITNWMDNGDSPQQGEKPLPLGVLLSTYSNWSVGVTLKEKKNISLRGECGEASVDQRVSLFPIETGMCVPALVPPP